MQLKPWITSDHKNPYDTESIIDLTVLQDSKPIYSRKKKDHRINALVGNAK